MAEGNAALACEQSTRQEERPYKCKQCPRSYRHAGSLVNHRRTHEVGLFPCLLCRKDFSNPMALKSHLRTHMEEKRRKCQDCGWSFRASSQLSSHHCMAHATRDQEDDEEGSNSGGCTSQRGQDTSSSDADTYSGAEGGGSLLTNLEKYIADSVVPADFSLLEFSIKRDVEKEEALRAHQGEKEAGLQGATADERRFKCNQCDKAYKHAGSLTNHKQSHTLGVYQCSMCYKEFSNLMALKSHTRLHSEYRPYQCRFCHKAFRLPSELLSHQKAHDEDGSEGTGRPAWEGSEHGLWEDSIETSAKLDIYQPPPAGSNLGDSAPCSLKDTSKAGGGERCSPDGELCVRCGGSFATEEELKGHSCLYPEEANEEEGGGSTPSQLAPGSNGLWEASLKGEEGDPTLEERPFRCEDCGRTYRHAGSLINHKKSHQIGVYSCSVCSKQLYNLAALKNHLRVHLKSKLGLPTPEETAQHPPSAASDLKQEANSPGEPEDCHIPPPDVWGGASCPKEEEEERGGWDEERPYRCGDCGRSYRHRGSLVNHRHTHQTGVFQCSICPKQYTNLMALRNHVRVHLRAARLSGREPVGCLSCASCGESFEEEAEFQLHQLRHLPCSEDIEAAAIPGLGGFHPQEADLLQAIKQDVEALENGAAVAEDILPSSQTPSVCNWCGLTFATAASLQDHVLQHKERLDGAAERPESPVPRLYGCDLCGKSYRHSGSLINHKQTHQTGDFSCSVCGKHFQNVASLKSHLRGHQRPRRAHSGMAVVTNADKDVEAEENTALPGMPPPGDEFKDSYDLLEDGAVVNGWQPQLDVPSPSPGNSEVLPYLCEQCGAGFDQASTLENHKQTHQLGIYQCSLCPKEYPSLLALKNHFHGHAKATASSRGSPSGNDGAEEQPFLCSLCGLIFPNEEDLQQHHNLVHEEGEGQAGGEDAELKTVSDAQGEDAGDQGEEQLLSHICGYCGETFDDMASLEEHSEGHKEEKAAALADPSVQLRWVPRLEEEEPRQQPSLMEVSVTADEPLDDRPYACSQCGKTYRHGGSLVNHKKIHQVGDYQCGICRRQYPNLSAYQNHLRNHPKCKLNGSVPELRQPVSVTEEGSVAGCQKDEPHDGRVLVHEGGKDPPGKSSCLSPGGEQRLEQEAALNGSQFETPKTLMLDGCGEESEEKAALEAHHGLRCAEKQQGEEEMVANEEEAAPTGGNENSSPGAEEEGSPSERPFRCEVCGRSYKHAGSLINHKQTHKTGLFHCGVCQKQFYNLMALKNHNRTHFETKRYRCPECPKAFRLQKQLASHQRVHRDRKREPSSHLSRGPPLARRAGKSENSARPLSVAKHHPDPEGRPYQCGECGRTYRHAGSLLNHQKSHKVGHFACPLCSKAYPNLMSLKNHQRIHYEVKRHRCLDCGRAFKWQRQLLRHQRRPHPCSNSSSSSGAPGHEHKRNWRAPEKERGGGQGDSPPGPFRCLLCSKQFPNRTSLRNHARAHSKKRFECSECGKAYRASRDLAHHLRRHRAEAEAAGGASSPSYLNTGTPPEEERPYKCTSCDRTYRHAGSLLNHKKAHAIGLYRCPTCQKEFYNLLALKNHLHIHTGKKRHRCSHCGKAFRTARRLAAHAKVHGSPKEEGTSFTCPVCSKMFFHQLSFRQHQLVHTGDSGQSAAGEVPVRDGS